MKKIILIITLFIFFVSCKPLSKLSHQKDDFVPKLELINNTKWYCFYVHDLELDMKYVHCEDDSTRFRKYYKEDKYIIIDTLDWGVLKPY